MTLSDPVATHGSSIEFARTDLVSNHTVFTDQESYRALLRNQDLPVHTYSSYMHEATHHWCFISPLMTGLSFLYLSAAKKALLWASTEDRGDYTELLNDLWAFELAINWLRPLNEGLAQFAEYDVMLSGSAACYSPPLLSTLNHLFNLPRLLEQHPGDDHTAAFYELMDGIAKWRLSRQVINRKSVLLLEPIESQGSSYLLGYLTVKQIWKAAARHCRPLENADVFLSFFRKLIFGDYALLAGVLDRKLNPKQRGLTLGNELHKRLELLRSGAFSSVPWKDWEPLLSMQSPEGPRRISYDVADPVQFGFMDTQAAVEKGIRLYDRFHAEVIHIVKFGLPGEAKEIAERFHIAEEDLPREWFPPDYFFNMLQQRHLMWLGDVAAQWIWGRERAIDVVVDGEVVLHKFVLPKYIRKKDLDGLRLDLYVDIYELYLVATLSIGEEIFGFHRWGDISDTARSKLNKSRLERRKIVHQTGIVHQVLLAYLEGTNFRQLVDEFWQDGARDLLDKTYAEFAFNYDMQAYQAFQKQGLAGVLQEDPDLVRNVAAISLAASAEMSPEGLRSVAEDPGLDPQGTINKVSSLWPSKRFRLAGIDEQGFLESAL